MRLDLKIGIRLLRMSPQVLPIHRPPVSKRNSPKNEWIACSLVSCKAVLQLFSTRTPAFDILQHQVKSLLQGKVDKLLSRKQ